MKTHVWLGILFISIIPVLVLADVIEYYDIQEDITTPKPIIVITYNERPITIHSYELYYANNPDQDTTSIPPIRYVSDGTNCQEPRDDVPTPSECEGKQFNFSVQGYLFNNKYTFYAYSTDSDDNVIEFYVDFTVKADATNIYVHEPTITYDSTYKHSMSDHNPFILDVEFFPRSYIETCYHAFYARDPGLRNVINQVESNEDYEHYQEYSAVYNYVRTQYPTQQFTPNTPIQPTGSAIKNATINMQGQFYTTDTLEALFIICNDTDPNKYHFDLVEVGYDNTAPIIQTASFTPSTINDASFPTTRLNITTNDYTVCWIENTAYPGVHQYPVPEAWSDFDSISDYTKQRTHNFAFSEFLHTCPCEYEFEIVCMNRAGNMSNTITRTLTIDIKRELDIRRVTPRYVSTTTIPLSISTNLLSDCRYSQDEENWNDFSNRNQEGGRVVHSSDVTVQGVGDYEFHTHCQAAGTEESYSFIITVDTTPPTRTDITFLQSPLCEGNPLRMRLNATDEHSGIDYYNYSIKQANTVIVDSQISNNGNVIYTLAGEPDKQYTIEAAAYDRAGNKGASSTNTITYREADHVDCDFVAPQGWVTLTDTLTGADATVHCEDEDSGCTNSYRYALIGLAESCSQANYQDKTYESGPIAITQNNILCWQVYDFAGNKDEGNSTIQVELNIELVAPARGFAPTETFLFELSTSRDATCRYDFNRENLPIAPAQKYAALSQLFDTTGQRRHHKESFNLVDMGANICQGQEDCSQDIIVICTENNRYHEEVYEIGYDTTPPNIITGANPNPIIESGNLVSTLYVTSDDRVWCTYSDEVTSYSFYEAPDINNPEQFVVSMQKVLPSFTPIGVPYEAAYGIQCMNLAGLEAHKEVIIRVDPQNQVDITMNTARQQTSRTVTLNISTLVQANCEYRFSVEETYRAFSTTGGTNHISTHNFVEDDYYDFLVQCTSTDGLNKGVAGKELVVDASPPVMIDILSNQYSCGLNRLRASFLSVASIAGLYGYNYSIDNQGGETIVPWKVIRSSGTQGVHEQISMQEGESYTWFVIALDQFGRASNMLTLRVEAQDETHPSCDFVAPQARIEDEHIYGGIQVFVSCADQETGCTDNYDYAFIPGTQMSTCQDAEYSTQRYDENPQFIGRAGTVCVRVYDKAGNNASAQEYYNLITSCYNGFQDINEEGIDCGGVCSLSCEQCSNGIQDINEEGVDCGGVCPNACQAVIIPGMPQACTEDWDCAQGHICINNICQARTPCESPIPSWWQLEHFGCECCVDELDDPDGDRFNNLEEYLAGTDPHDPKSKPKGQGQPIGLWLIIAGIIFSLAGIGYLVYDRYYGSSKKNTDYTGGNVAFGGQDSSMSHEEQKADVQSDLPPEELRRIEQERLEAARKKARLQARVKQRKQQEKQQQRKSLLSSFQEPGLKAFQKPQESTEEKTSSNTQETPINDGEKAREDVAQRSEEEYLSGEEKSKAVTEHQEALEEERTLEQENKIEERKVDNPERTNTNKKTAFSDLDTFLESSTHVKSQENNSQDVFKKIADFTGSSEIKVKEVINKDHTSTEELSSLFAGAKKSSVTPNNITPVFKELLEKGSIGRDVAQETIHKLAQKKLLTHKQKEQVLTDLGKK